MSVVANRFLLMCITVRLSSLIHGTSKLYLQTVFNGSYVRAKRDPLHSAEGLIKINWFRTLSMKKNPTLQHRQLLCQKAREVEHESGAKVKVSNWWT